MFSQLKTKLNDELKLAIPQINKKYGLSKISPLLFDVMKNFILRDGKRVRPILFISGYLGFSKKPAANLYRSALGIELLHDFLLVHDDIIDKSDTRRGEPSMHVLLRNYLVRYPRAKFNGQDLAIVVGDVMYSLAMDFFLAIDENPLRKEKALRKFIEAACYTGCGEFAETVYGAENIKNITLKDIYKIYDYKTAYYTFVCPLTSGAIMAGAADSEVKKLYDYGIYIGRAFQINDDILGMFGNEVDTGKSSLTDLQENKKTLLLWYAYNNIGRKKRIYLEKLLAKKNISTADLVSAQEIIRESSSLDYAKNQIKILLDKSLTLLKKSKIKDPYRQELINYSRLLLQA